MSLLWFATTTKQFSSLSESNQAGGRVFLFLDTDDFWRDYKGMTEHGITFIREPKVESYGTVAVFRDLYGNLWDLVQRSTVPASSGDVLQRFRL